MTHTLQELQTSPSLGLNFPADDKLVIAVKAVAQRLLPWLVPLALIAAWHVASSSGWLSTRVLPAPLDVVQAAWSLAESGELWKHVKVSAARALTLGARFDPWDLVAYAGGVALAAACDRARRR